MNLSLTLFIIGVLGFVLYIKDFPFLVTSNKTVLLARIFFFLLINLFNFFNINKNYYIYLICLIVILSLLFISIYADNKFFIYYKYIKKLLSFKFVFLVLSTILLVYLSFTIFSLKAQGIDISIHEFKYSCQIYLPCLEFLSEKFSFHSLSYQTMGNIPIYDPVVYSASSVDFCNTDKPYTGNTSVSGLASKPVGTESTENSSVSNISTANETKSYIAVDNKNEGSNSKIRNSGLKINIDPFPKEYIESINPNADIEGLKAEKKYRDATAYCEHDNTTYFVSVPDQPVPLCDFSGEGGTDKRKEIYMPDKHEAVKYKNDIATLCKDCNAVFCSDCRDLDPDSDKE